jgi:hypothetical protein
MDDRGTLWPVHHHQFEEVSRSVRPEHQIPDRIVGDLFDDQRILQDVLHVVGLDIVAKGRMEDLHWRSVLRNRIAGTD